MPPDAPETINILVVCLLAITEVFLLLGLMAIIISLITRIFPATPSAPKSEKPRRKARPQKGAARLHSAGNSAHLAAGKSHDPAVVAAISMTASQNYPGMIVTGIQEIDP
jgi:hypothetical protein